MISLSQIARSVAVVALLGAPLAACSSGPGQESTGEYIDSAAITAKVKAELINDPVTKAGQISVETFRDVVQLSGFTDSAQAKTRAEQIARNVRGVRSVRNDLIVK